MSSSIPKLTTGERLRLGDDTHRGPDEWDRNCPGLLDSLGRLERAEIGAEDHIRQQLIALQDLPEFITFLAGLNDHLRKMVEQFMAGKSAEEVTGGDFVPPLGASKESYPNQTTIKLDASAQTKLGGPSVILDDGGKDMTILENLKFENWGRNITNTPSITAIPTTVAGLQTIMKKAISGNKRIRGAGFRHTWSDMYTKTGEILVSLLSIPVATGSSEVIAKDAVDGPKTEFNQIQLADVDVPGTDGKKRWARVGAGVSNEGFRRWALKNGWTLPINVIMVEITFGGSNAPICHGAGISHNTLSDLVREIEYVDVHGNTQSISDRTQLQAAAGAFGLLGIVTHVTLELDKLTYANLQPAKVDVQSAIPPPAGYKVPADIPYNLNEDQRKKAESNFIKQANSYYSEWFWYPYNEQVWVNCWDNTDDPKRAVEYPDAAATYLQWLESSAADIVNSTKWFQRQPGWKQGTFNGGSAMALMPPRFLFSGRLKTPLINALHFRRGIQNFHVRCTELIIPIPPLESDPSHPDWSVVQRAWWDALSIVTDDMKKTGALRIVLELRIMGSSDIIMAPQTQNKFGSACIEVISNLASGEDGSWQPLVQKLVDAWTSYEDKGQKLNVRPHWAKEWEDYKVNGLEMKQHLKDVAYYDQIAQFRDALTSIGATQGWTLQNLHERVSNPLLDYLYFPEFNTA